MKYQNLEKVENGHICMVQVKNIVSYTYGNSKVITLMNKNVYKYITKLYFIYLFIFNFLNLILFQYRKKLL